ncbi:Oxygen-dependent choline dehydrogenase 1 [Orchesella cincta]|uniref:Oxygen-dependent choline dehydrogenase 1 n=1 Tax=Orchesella cincta TaxID=48709 RepID=A0A1D2MRP6_ORCCI|nr:Oxygen-dependent choline dehydrogenase 1 [Orchesella cincta]
MKLAAFVFGAIPLLIQFYSKKYLQEDKTATLTELENDLNLPRFKEFDFIVVGAGPAGCIIAGRLSERFNVLLLEAGGEPVPASQVPFFAIPVATDRDTNYFWPSLPQRYAAQDTDGIITVHLGKMFGGSDSHNEMVHLRGSPHDYDNYARILNDSSWRYENVLEHFKKYENFIGALFTGEYEENYGHGGPITIDTDVPAFLPIWFDVARELGYPVGDPNGFQKESFAPMAKNIKNGQRSNAYNEYIKPYKNTRQNLTVLPYSTATQILIDDNKNAYGVLYERHGIPQIAHASKEVIISAGIFSSPLLLMKSGVGPRDQLEEAGVPVKHELASVGQNLGDHLHLSISDIQYNASILPYVPRMPEDREFEDMLQEYIETGEGILGILQEGVVGYVVSSRAKQAGEETWPDIQFAYDPMCPAPSGDDLPTSCFYLFNGRTKMRGEMRLNATAYKNGVKNDVELALIDYRVFEGEAASDMDVLLEGIDNWMRVINSTTMQKFGTVYAQEPHPSCTQHEFLSQDYWRCFVTRTVSLGLHGVGTCSLGSVLDSKFRVQGISGLRVADASVFPVVPNSNLNSPIMMMAEKASADILQTWV